MNALPTVFVSHGAPTFAIELGLAGAQLRALGLALGKPRAVVVVSPHWMTQGVEITATDKPQTVHDFGGFPRALYSLQYPAPGLPELAVRIQQQLQSQGIPARLDGRRGLDHGAWVPLMHLFPESDVPVVQVSLPFDVDEAKAFALGKALAPLAQDGVLIVGSGSLTHNLYEFPRAKFRPRLMPRSFLPGCAKPCWTVTWRVCCGPFRSPLTPTVPTRPRSTSCPC